MLNVVQRPDGSLDPEVETMLGQLADWNEIHGQAIFGTRPWLVYGESSVKVSGGAFKEDFKYNAKEIRFTTKGSTLYAFALGWPEDRQITIRSLAKPPGQKVNNISSVSLLGYRGKVQWKQTAEALVVTLPEKKVSEFTAALKINGSKLTNIPFTVPTPSLSPDARGNVKLGADDAELHGDQIKTENQVLRNPRPSTSMTFNGVERVINVIDHATTPYRVLKEVTVEEIRSSEPWNQSTPDHYAILVSGSSSVTILMNCVPTTRFTLYADGLTSLSDLSGSQVPALPASFHDILKHGALADEYRKMEKVRLAEDAQMQYERRLSDLRMFLAKSAMRDDYQGKTAYGPLGQSGGAGGGGSAGTRLDQIDNPIASKTFEMAGYNLELHYGTGRFVVSGGATPPPEIRVTLDGYSPGHLQSVNTEVLWLSRNISYDGVGQNLDDINEYGLALATNIDVADSGVRGWRYLSFTPGANPRSSNLRHFLKETGGADHYGTPVLISAPYATVAVRNGAGWLMPCSYNLSRMSW